MSFRIRSTPPYVRVLETKDLLALGATLITAAAGLAAGPAMAAAPDGCGAQRPGETCRAGEGQRSPGGGDKVSHEGWPAITGIFWQVVDLGAHELEGGSGNDELLGHNGDDRISGGDGADVIWGDWDPRTNPASQADRLSGGAGDDWLYSSHGRNTIRGGAGADVVWAYYGRGTIDCGPGRDTLRVRLVNEYSWRNCERIKNFCAFGSKPGDRGGCYKPGERPASRRTPGGK